MSSRLFLEVREKRGLAYEVYSTVTHFQDCGAFIVSAGVAPKRIYAAVDTILAELGRMRDDVPAEELDKAKRLTAGRLLLRMEDTRAVASWLASHELLLGEIVEVDDVVQRIESVTPQEMRKVANEMLTTEKLNMAVVGPHRAETRFQRSLQL